MLWIVIIWFVLLTLFDLLVMGFLYSKYIAHYCCDYFYFLLMVVKLLMPLMFYISCEGRTWEKERREGARMETEIAVYDE